MSECLWQYVCRLRMSVYLPLGLCVLAFLSLYTFVHVTVYLCASSPKLQPLAWIHLISLSHPGFIRLACFLQQTLIRDQPDAYQKWWYTFCSVTLEVSTSSHPSWHALLTPHPDVQRILPFWPQRQWCSFR